MNKKIVAIVVDVLVPLLTISLRFGKWSRQDWIINLVVSFVEMWAKVFGPIGKTELAVRMDEVFIQILGWNVCPLCLWAIKPPATTHIECAAEQTRLAKEDEETQATLEKAQEQQEIEQVEADAWRKQDEVALELDIEAYARENPVPELWTCQQCGAQVSWKELDIEQRCAACRAKAEAEEEAAYDKYLAGIEQTQEEDDLCPCGHPRRSHYLENGHCQEPLCDCPEFGADPQLWEKEPQEALLGDPGDHMGSKTYE